MNRDLIEIEREISWVVCKCVLKGKKNTTITPQKKNPCTCTLTYSNIPEELSTKDFGR